MTDARDEVGFPAPKPEAPTAAVYLAVFLLCFCVLALEIALSRLFSVVLRYHFVFLMISTALCGLGLGGLAVHLGRLTRARWVEHALPLAAIGFSLATVAALIVVMRLLVPYALYAYWAMAAVLAVPFGFAGVFLAEVFRRYPAHSGALYSADLLGAATASAGVILLLNRWGAINGSLWLAALGLVPALLLVRSVRARLVTGAVVAIGFALVLLFAGGNRAHPFLDVPPVRLSDPAQIEILAKPLFVELARPPDRRPRILHSEWTAFARTDVVHDPEAGDDVLLVYTNGHVPTNMIRSSGRLEDVAYLAGELGYFPFGIGRPKRVLCIGPGAGMDVWFGLLSGAERIEGVELNPSILPLMRRYRDFNGGLYERPNVHIVTGEGRSYVMRSRERYDLIFLALTQTSTSGHSGLTLLESYVHSLDAFRDYWRRLTDAGQIALITQEPQVAVRFFTTALALLRENGIAAPAASRHCAVVSLSPERMRFSPYRYLFLLRKVPWDGTQIERMERVAAALGFVPLFLPGRQMEEPYASVYRGWTDLPHLLAGYRFRGLLLDVRPCTDDRPFFLDLAFGVPPLFTGLCVGAALLVVGFVAGALAWKRWRERTSPRPLVPFAAYFACLGVGFMLVEIPLLQKLILLLEYPTLAMAVVLAALLVGGGLGSMASQRFGAVPERGLIGALMGVVLLTLAVGWGLPHVAPAMLGLPLVARCAAVTALLLPLGFCLGIPFPSGVRLLARVSADDVAWMWAVNGVMSVVGSLLAAIGAKLYGFQMVSIGGVVVYCVALALVPRLGRATSTGP